MLIHIVGTLALLGIGFGLGRVKHPSNLKLANIEAALKSFETTAVTDVKTVITKIKSLL